MDPISAALAFTGLGSSLIKIADTILKLTKELFEFQRKFKNARRKILQLHRDLQNLRDLVIAIHVGFSNPEAIDYPLSLRTICERFIVQLEQDLQELQAILDRSNIEQILPVSKRFKARAQHVLAENTINEFRGRITTHIGYLSLVQTLISNYKVDHLGQNTLDILNETRALVTSISSEMQLRNFYGLQQQMHPAIASGRKRFERGREETLSSIEIYEKRKTYDFGLGLLSFQVARVCSTGGSTPVQVRDDMRLKASFLPPSWMSRTALQVTIYLPGPSSVNSSGPRVSLQPTTINQDTELLKALHRFDLRQLKHLFETNRAQPTDMVLDLEMDEPITLHQSSSFQTQGDSIIPDRSDDITIAESAIIFSLTMEKGRYDDLQKNFPAILHYYLQIFLDYHAVSLDSFSIQSKYFFPQGWVSSSVSKPHPRKSVISDLHWDQMDTSVPATEDEATLLVLHTTLTTVSSSVEKKLVEQEDVSGTMVHLPSARPSCRAYLNHQIEWLKARAINIISKLLHFPPKEFSCLEIVMNCENSACLECWETHVQEVRKLQWRELFGMTFLEALLLRLSFAVMVGMILVYDVAGLIITLRNSGKLPQLFWVGAGMILLFVLLT